MTPISHVSYCDICGKKLRGQTAHGLEVSRAMHYKNRHNLSINVIEAKSNRTIIKAPARVAAD